MAQIIPVSEKGKSNSSELLYDKLYSTVYVGWLVAILSLYFREKGGDPYDGIFTFFVTGFTQGIPYYSCYSLCK